MENDGVALFYVYEIVGSGLSAVGGGVEVNIFYSLLYPNTLCFFKYSSSKVES
jgi:hypothetical protein